jgi:hypothetical protein
MAILEATDPAAAVRDAHHLQQPLHLPSSPPWPCRAIKGDVDPGIQQLLRQSLIWIDQDSVITTRQQGRMRRCAGTQGNLTFCRPATGENTDLFFSDSRVQPSSFLAPASGQPVRYHLTDLVDIAGAQGNDHIPGTRLADNASAASSRVSQ